MDPPQSWMFQVEKAEQVGKKKNYDVQLEAVSSLPLWQRGALRSSAASGIPKTTLIQMLKEGKLRAHSNAMKPT